MNSVALKTGILLLVLLASHNLSDAQVAYQEHLETDEVLIEYRWQKEKFFARNPHALLNLQVTNLTGEHMVIRFAVGFYRDQQLFFESEAYEICLEPGESLRGRRGDLRFKAEDIRMDVIEEDWFDWDIVWHETEQVDACD